jgi:hypothetical protein
VSRLIVAHQTADSRALVEAVARRADAGSCSFTLLVPASSRGLHRVIEPEDHGMAEAERRLEAAIGVENDAIGLPTSTQHVPAA